MEANAGLKHSTRLGGIQRTSPLDFATSRVEILPTWDLDIAKGDVCSRATGGGPPGDSAPTAADVDSLHEQRTRGVKERWGTELCSRGVAKWALGRT